MTRRYKTLDDWPTLLFIQNADLYLPALESMKNQATAEVEGLCIIWKNSMFYPVQKSSISVVV